MANVLVDIHLWDTPAAVELGRLLGDDDAWRFLVRLWAWQLGAKNVTGDVTHSPVQIARAVGYEGDPKRLVKSLVKSGWLEEHSSALYMHGWSKNAKYFHTCEQNRERKRRERLRNVTLDVTRDGAPIPSSSSSSDLKEGLKKEAKAPRATPSAFSRLDSLEEKLSRYDGSRSVVEDMIGILAAGHKLKSAAEGVAFLRELDGWPVPVVVSVARFYTSWDRRWKVGVPGVRTLLEKHAAETAAVKPPAPARPWRPEDARK